ncbi:MAG: hypothetical protein IT196_10345 [Acidimicrobiales bacterium]|nr:hypothetical protein [Acidimicrobiales bacterium]
MTEHTTTRVAAGNAAEVGHEAKGQAADVAHEAGAQLQNAWHDIRRDLRIQASQQTERAGTGLRRLDTQLQALRRGDIEAAGPVAGYADQLQAKVQDLARRVEDEGFDGIVADLRSFARRRPGMFLASAAAAGFLAGRLARGAAAAAHEDGVSATNGAATMPRAASTPGIGATVPPGTMPIGTMPIGTAPSGTTPSGTTPPSTAGLRDVDPYLEGDPVVTPTALDDPYPTTGMSS